VSKQKYGTYGQLYRHKRGFSGFSQSKEAKDSESNTLSLQYMLNENKKGQATYAHKPPLYPTNIWGGSLI